MDPDRNWGKMETNRPDALPSEDAEMVKGRVLEKRPLPNWLFNDQDLIPALEYAKDIERKDLLNLLNYTHFVEGTVLVHLRHQSDGHSILLRAYPSPCLGSQFSGYWAHGSLPGLELDCYRFRHLIIEDGKSMIVVPAELVALSQESFSIQLPERSYSVSRRRLKRHPSRGVLAELAQNDSLVIGELADFNSSGFRIKLRHDSLWTFGLFDLNEPIGVTFQRGDEVCFSSMCRCIRRHHNRVGIEVVMDCQAPKVNRFKQRWIRNPRQQLVTSTSVVFEHPLVNKWVSLEVCDISTSGLSVYEKADEEMLIPGLLIPELTIIYAGALKMKCAAQIIYRMPEGGKGVRCGIAFLDMQIDPFSRLAHIIANTIDPHSSISSEVDVNALWKFFFETGFINPSKYHLLHSHRHQVKNVYRRMYEENPEIARHFIYQREGVIYGHISMVRIYQKAWMVHHHAARMDNNRRGGLQVLRQLMHYLNDMHRLPSTKVDYVFSFFRPENAFPNKIFGGFAKVINDRKLCSTDLFSYFTFTRSCGDHQLKKAWSLYECSEAELDAIRECYEHISGGLLFDAFGLNKPQSADEPLEEVYRRLGFTRKFRIYALTHRAVLKAAIMIDLSEEAFNLSGLLNCVKILSTDSDILTWDVISSAISVLDEKYGTHDLPVLIYPSDWTIKKQVQPERQYQLWIVNLRAGGGDAFMEYMQRRYRACYMNPRVPVGKHLVEHKP